MCRVYPSFSSSELLSAAACGSVIDVSAFLVSRWLSSLLTLRFEWSGYSGIGPFAGAVYNILTDHQEGRASSGGRRKMAAEKKEDSAYEK